MDNHKGFGGFDFSPRINWDVNLQRFNLLLSKLADAFLAINGVKLMPNFRTGCLDTFEVLSIYPPNTWYSVGALGCGRGRIKINEMYLRTKLIVTNPNMLIYYGKLKPEYAHILDEYGVQYKVFADFQRLSRRKEALQSANKMLNKQKNDIAEKAIKKVIDSLECAIQAGTFWEIDIYLE